MTSSIVSKPESPAIDALRARFKPHNFPDIKQRVIDNSAEILDILGAGADLISEHINDAASGMAELYGAKLNEQKILFAQILDTNDELSLRILNKQFLAYGRVMVSVGRLARVSLPMDDLNPRLDFDIYG